MPRPSVVDVIERALGRAALDLARSTRFRTPARADERLLRDVQALIEHRDAILLEHGLRSGGRS